MVKQFDCCFGDFERAEQLRQIFEPLEDLRNGINPIRVLHAAVDQAGIAATGPLIPLLSEVSNSQAADIQAAAKQLLETELAARS